MKKGTKRKAAAASRKDAPATEEHQQQQNREPTQVARATKRSKISKPGSEPEFFDEQREYEDLWKQIFCVGTEWHHLDLLSKVKWQFSSLEDAFVEGGVLHGKKVYLFICTEEQLVNFHDHSKVTCIPTVVAVVSPFPPSDKIGVKSPQRELEEIVDMKKMKMDWVPYIPLGKSGSSVERLKSQIFILSCVQRRAGLKQLKEDRVMKFQYCLPYFYDPFKEDEIEPSTTVDIMYPMEPEPVVCEYDWDFHELEEFTNELIKEEKLPEDQKDAFKKVLAHLGQWKEKINYGKFIECKDVMRKEFVREKVREAKRANREAREKRKNAQEAMSEEKKAAFENIKFYKFYPASADQLNSPYVSNVKSPFINRYYGKAHQVF